MVGGLAEPADNRACGGGIGPDWVGGQLLQDTTLLFVALYNFLSKVLQGLSLRLCFFLSRRYMLVICPMHVFISS